MVSLNVDIVCSPSLQKRGLTQVDTTGRQSSETLDSKQMALMNGVWMKEKAPLYIISQSISYIISNK